MTRLTHVDEAGNARMVDVGAKPETERVAVAEGWITLGSEAMQAVQERRLAKGDVLVVAQVAGIAAAKRTADLIPLCHPLPLTNVEVVLSLDPPNRVHCRVTVRTVGRTGVEMEALTSVSAALLTVYDMVKALDKGPTIGPVRLVEKRGGRSGTWVREP